jgi:hypothetical protein
MTEYVYRVDAQTSLEKIRDSCFRARRWSANDSYSFPHALLKHLHSSLPATDGLYRICFYTSHTRAEESLSYDFSYFGASHILRCPKAAVLSLGFTDSWDDGFKEGDAYLFWIQEHLNDTNANFSSAGIAFDQLEIWKQEQWSQLQDHYSAVAPVAKPVAPPAGKTRSSVPASKKRLWWKFWCCSNG